MRLTIKSATLEAGNYGDYMKVTGVDDNGKEVTKNISDKLKDKWDLLQENATVNIKMAQKNNKWYVDGVEPFAIQVDGAKITEQQKAPPVAQTKPAPSIRENMEWKEKQINLKFWQGQLGNRIGDGSIDRDFPNSKVKIKGQYYKQMEAVTGISMKKEGKDE